MVVGSLTSVARSVAEAVTSEDSHTNIVNAETVGSGSFGMIAGVGLAEDLFQVGSFFSRPVLTVIEGGKSLGVASATMELSSFVPAAALGLMTIALFGSPDTFIGGEPGVVTEEAAMIAGGGYYDPATGEDVVSQPVMEEGTGFAVSNSADDEVFQMFLDETSLEGVYGFDYALWNLYRDCQMLIAEEYKAYGSGNISKARQKLDELIQDGVHPLVGSVPTKLPHAMHGLDQLLASKFALLAVLNTSGAEDFIDPSNFERPLGCASLYVSRMAPAGYINDQIKRKLLFMRENLGQLKDLALKKGYKSDDIMIKHIDDILKVISAL